MRYNTPDYVSDLEFQAREEAQDFAIQWQADFASQDYSWSEMAEWGNFFERLAGDFWLREEFKENGII